MIQTAANSQKKPAVMGIESKVPPNILFFWAGLATMPLLPDTHAKLVLFKDDGDVMGPLHRA